MFLVFAFSDRNFCRSFFAIQDFGIQFHQIIVVRAKRVRLDPNQLCMAQLVAVEQNLVELVSFIIFTRFVFYIFFSQRNPVAVLDF